MRETLAEANPGDVSSLAVRLKIRRQLVLRMPAIEDPATSRIRCALVKLSVYSGKNLGSPPNFASRRAQGAANMGLRFDKQWSMRFRRWIYQTRAKKCRNIQHR
jgi:hypothetical protein